MTEQARLQLKMKRRTEGMISTLLGKATKEPIELEPVRSRDESGEELVCSLKKSGFLVTPKARQILESPLLWPVQVRGQRFHPVIIPDKVLGVKNNTIESARRKARELNLIDPTIELAPLLRFAIKRGWMKQRKLHRIVVPHAHIVGNRDAQGGAQRLHLGIHSYDRGDHLAAFADYPGFDWGKGMGWVFLKPDNEMRQAA